MDNGQYCKMMKAARTIALVCSLLGLMGCPKPQWSSFHISAYPVKPSYPAADGSTPERVVRLDMIREKDRSRPTLHSVIISVRDPVTNKVQYRDEIHLDLVSPQNVAVEWMDADAFTIVFSGQQKRQYRRISEGGGWNPINFDGR